MDECELAGECQLCGAPGGWPYCNSSCEAADNPEPDEEGETR